MAPRKFRFFFHHTCSHMLATGLNTPPTNALETSKAFALSVFIHFCIWGCMTASWASADCWSIVKKLKHIRRDFAQSIKISSFFITGLLIDSNTVYLWSLLAENCRLNILLSWGVSRHAVKPFLQANSCSWPGSLMWRCAAFATWFSWTVFTAEFGQHKTWDLSIISRCLFSWHHQTLFISWSWQINSLGGCEGRYRSGVRAGIWHMWRCSLCLHLRLDKVLKVWIFNLWHLHQSKLNSRHLPLFMCQTPTLTQNHPSRVAGVISEGRCGWHMDRFTSWGKGWHPSI